MSQNQCYLTQNPQSRWKSELISAYLALKVAVDMLIRFVESPRKRAGISIKEVRP